MMGAPCNNAYQIDLHEYKVGHAEEDCSCIMVTVDIDLAISILKKPGSLPLLKIIYDEQSLDSLRVEVVEYEEGTEYTAISHVCDRS
jgi:hypothetical protein